MDLSLLNMDRKGIVVLVVVVLMGLMIYGLIEGTITGNLVKDEEEKPESETKEYTGIKVSGPELNEEKEVIHNIFNFDEIERKVIVTNLCYDISRNLIDDSDTYVMTLAPESVSGWKPDCPPNTDDYRIDIGGASETDKDIKT